MVRDEARDVEGEIFDRIKQIVETDRKTKSQMQIARELDISPQYLSKLLYPTESTHITERIVQAFLKYDPNMDEAWFRTGVGERKRPKTKESVISGITKRLIGSEMNSKYFQLLRIVGSLTEDDIDILYELAEEWIKCSK